MDTLYIILLAWVGFVVLVYVTMWIEHNDSLRGFINLVHGILVEMDKED